jgi:hypothetical protein
MNIMLTRLLRCLVAVLVVFSLSLPSAVGQDDLKVERGVKVKKEAADDDESSSSSSPALPYFVLIVYSMLVLTIVFMPSRKA